MVDLEKRFFYWDWKCERRQVTAKKLYQDVLKELILPGHMFVRVPVMEIVRMTEEPDFPAFYAEKIRCAVLEWFSDHAISKLHIGRAESEALNRCYNLLETSNPEALEAKAEYLDMMIKETTKDLFWQAGKGHCGPMYCKKYRKWVNAQVNKWIQKEEIDFSSAKLELRKSFKDFVTRAKSNGVFQEDATEYQKFWEE